MKIIEAEKKQEIESIEKKPLTEQIKELKQFKEEILSGGVKSKKIKIPRKLKANKKKLKKGYIGILKVQENGNVSMEKQKVEDFTFKTKDGHYHITDGREKLMWLGKFPFVIQKSWRNNPELFDAKNDENETYGDKYKMAKMLADTIKVKKKGGNIIIWVLVGVAVLVGINLLGGGKIF
jgi:hypothetical protein